MMFLSLLAIYLQGYLDGIMGRQLPSLHPCYVRGWCAASRGEFHPGMEQVVLGSSFLG